MDIYDRLQVRKLINARGTMTVIGGSIMPPEVVDAIREGAGAYVDMGDLLAKAGEHIAELLGVEAAYVTSGAAAGLAVAAAACMAGRDPARVLRLPETEGMPNELLMFKAQRFAFDQAVRVAGAKIVEIGLSDLVLIEELEAAINERTAAFLYRAEVEQVGGSLPIESVAELCRRKGIPLIVDAAAELPPVENLSRFSAMGAGLTIFSGGKDLRGPQSTGLILGEKGLVEACALNGFPNYSIGRSMKVCKEDICGLVRAIELYLAQDFEKEADFWANTVESVITRLSPIAGVRVWRAFPAPPSIRPADIPRAYLQVDKLRVGLSIEELHRALLSGTPGIDTELERDTIVINPQMLTEQDALVVTERLAALLELRTV